MSLLYKVQNKAKLISSFRIQESSVFWGENEWGHEECVLPVSVPFHDLTSGYIGVYVL